MSAAATPLDGLEAQDALIKKLESDHFGWDILVGDAFIRGMRDIGYKSTSFALAELIDNSIQASASKIDLVFSTGARNLVDKIAVIDDGYGMQPKMVRASLVWGAGTRADNRAGFGKYGYGLPSASVSQGHHVSVYSKTQGGDWYRAYLDIDEIKEGKWQKDNRIEIPTEVKADLPAFVKEYIKSEKSADGSPRWPNFNHGTVVVWEGLDRLDYSRREKLRADLVTNLGVIYRNFLLATPMRVDGIDVEPCDPLFLTEGFRYYDLDEDRAIGYDPAPVEVKDKSTGEVIGRMRVRFSRMPATFFRKPEFKETNRPGKGGTNERLEIADANNGVIFARNGRQIDVIRPPRSLGNINATTDRFWSVEVDFDASLDDYFHITTSKQQVRPDDSIWDMLKDSAKLFETIGTMRTAYKKEADQVAARAEEAKEGQRASVAAIEAGKKFRTTKPPTDTPEREAEAKGNLEEEAKKRARRSGIQAEAVQRELSAEREGRTHSVETEDLPGAPFFRCVQEGGTRVLYLNVAHPFYGDLYQGSGSTTRLRAGLEVLLWSLGEAEVDAPPGSDRRRFYERDRASIWSPYVADSLEALKDISLIEAADDGDGTAA